MAAERDATDRYLAAFLSDRIGATFRGRISGVTRFGLFVRLNETGADGIVPIRTLGNDYFIHDEATHALIGDVTGATYPARRAGEVRLVEAAPITGGLVFELLSEPLTYRRKRGKSGQSGKARGQTPQARGSNRLRHLFQPVFVQRAASAATTPHMAARRCRTILAYTSDFGDSGLTVTTTQSAVRAEHLPSRPVLASLLAGFRLRCPNCRTGALEVLRQSRRSLSRCAARRFIISAPTMRRPISPFSSSATLCCRRCLIALQLAPEPEWVHFVVWPRWRSALRSRCCRASKERWSRCNGRCGCTASATRRARRQRLSSKKLAIPGELITACGDLFQAPRHKPPSQTSLRPRNNAEDDT